MTVYFALEVDSGRIKIGYSGSEDPQKDRITPNLTLNSSDVRVIASVDGTERTERDLHYAFAHYRYRRRDGSVTEFFEPSAELWSLIGYIQNNGKLPCPPIGCADLIWRPE